MTRRIAFALLALAGAATAQNPLADASLTPATPQPDPDLVIVREKSYGVEGIDLTPYGIGTGNDQFVQSIYFRFYIDANNDAKSTAGRVVFPPEIEILGVITSEADLGGSSDDGVFTASDLDFGIGTNPDLYSETARGYESSGDEFVCVVSPQTLVFGMSVTFGVDDFRLIVDYGNSFPADLDFDVGFYDLPTLSNVPPSRGYQIGDVANPTVPGSGDFGEAGSLLGIPLTSTTGPTEGCVIGVNPETSVHIIRNTSGPSAVDAFDVDLRIPAPNLVDITGGVVTTPAGMTAGPDNLLYAVGAGGGYAIIDPRGSLIDTDLLDNLAGNITDLTGNAGERKLYMVRDTGGNTLVDRLDVDTRVFEAMFTIPSSSIGTPRGIADANDGLLYVLGSGAGFGTVDPVGGAYTDIGVAPPTGTYADLTGRPGVDRVYLLRNTASGNSVDVHDIGAGMTTYDFVADTNIGTPVGITVGPNGNLCVIGSGGGFAAFDPDTGALLQFNACMDFTGSNVDIAFTDPGPVGAYCTAKTNSQGCVPSIGSTGTASISDPNPFTVSATDVINNKSGILIYGLGPNSVPFQGAFLCIQPPIRRTPPVMSGGNPPPNDCSGVLSFDFNAFIQSGSDPNLAPCTSVYCQYWYRDLQEPAGFGTGLSNGLQFEIQL